ncbi:MAG: porin family protein [Psychroflexus sp.]|uniref:porin family protein n=1 Tax=Psychroflexus sp. S27 TaxID=1982757 RepID=UPI000C2A7968|nr:porin family protein [Psychroflexus sp. S27]PJX20125.1 hypothetical protein CAP47_11370 [Psychroflexus sp. S27]
MKKLLLFTVFTVLSFTTAVAQQINFGAKAGVNFATLTGDVDDASTKVGLHVGGVAEYMINEKLSLQAELLYSMQGAKNEYTETNSFNDYSEIYSEEATYKLNYINLPVMAKYFFTDNFSVIAGPQISFLTSAKADFDEVYTITTGGSTTVETESISDLDIKDALKSIDFGLNLGLGYKLDNGLNFEARYNLGLMNIDDSPTEAGDPETSIKNGVIQVSLGFMF